MPSHRDWLVTRPLLSSSPSLLGHPVQYERYHFGAIMGEPFGSYISEPQFPQVQGGLRDLNT